MGLFDKVRQVLSRLGRGRPADDRPSGQTGSAADPPAATQEHPPSPGTAQPAQSLSAAAREPEAPSAKAEESTDATDAAKAEESTEATDATKAESLRGDVPDAGSTGDEQVPEQAPRRYRTHTLQPGQSLADVATLHGVGEEQVAELNGLDPELVFAGQVVRIPHT